MALQRLPINHKGIAASASYIWGVHPSEKPGIAASTFHVGRPLQHPPTELTPAKPGLAVRNFGCCRLSLPTIAASAYLLGLGKCSLHLPCQGTE